MSDEENIEDKEEQKGIITRLIEYSKGIPTSSVVIYIIASTPLGFSLGIKIGIDLLLPIINALLIYPVYLLYITRKRYKTAVAMVIFWAVILSAFTILYTYQEPSVAKKIIIRGGTYTEEMWEWLETGKGIEGDITRFFPQHIIHLSLFIMLTLATGGFGGLVSGSILLNYMNYYVGCLALTSTNPGVISLIGWPIWAEIRVVGYIILSIFFATPLIFKISNKRWKYNRFSNYLYSGLALIIADIILKYLLAPIWRGFIVKYIP